MVVVPPATPPSTVVSPPSSPASPADTSTQGFESDLEKGQYNEKSDGTHNKDARLEKGGDVQVDTTHSRVLSWAQKASALNPLPKHPWRKEDGREKLIQRIDDHPKGYPQLAAVLNSDENFLICRRFGFLHSRVLLYRQDELYQLEKRLLALDEADADEFPLRLQSRQVDNEQDEEQIRKTLIGKIDEKLKDYDDLVQRIKTSMSTKAVSTRNYNSLYTWMWDRKPLCRGEMQFIKHREDFVALADEQEGGWFDAIIENVLGYLPRRVAQAIFTHPDQRKKSDDAYVHLYSKYRIDVLVRLTLTIIAVVLLMAPTTVLFIVPEHGNLKIVLILLFTLLFSAAISVFTKARRHEMFAATAAYVFALVIFECLFHEPDVLLSAIAFTFFLPMLALVLYSSLKS